MAWMLIQRALRLLGYQKAISTNVLIQGQKYFLFGTLLQTNRDYEDLESLYTLDVNARFN